MGTKLSEPVVSTGVRNVVNALIAFRRKREKFKKKQVTREALADNARNLGYAVAALFDERERYVSDPKPKQLPPSQPRIHLERLAQVAAYASDERASRLGWSALDTEDRNAFIVMARAIVLELEETGAAVVIRERPTERPCVGPLVTSSDSVFLSLELDAQTADAAERVRALLSSLVGCARRSG